MAIPQHILDVVNKVYAGVELTDEEEKRYCMEVLGCTEHEAERVIRLHPDWKAKKQQGTLID